MKITVFGAGYVGLVTAIGFAELKHSVEIVDIDEEKIQKLNSRQLPFYEPELDIFLKINLEENRLRCRTESTFDAEIIFIAVDTPKVENVIRAIAHSLKPSTLIAIRSTVEPGTCKKMQDFFEAHSISASIVSNPEFLSAGTAWQNFMNPSRVILGADDEKSFQKIYTLYADFMANEKILRMSSSSAELSKLSANAFLATKISFINSIANLAEKCQANILDIQKGLGCDPRIGPLFLNAGCGYGGSCFSKDMQMLINYAHTQEISALILESAETINEQQKIFLVEKLRIFFNSDISRKRIAVWGLSFKPNTDDIRNAPSLSVLSYLFSQNVIVQAYDPKANSNIRVFFPNENKLNLFEDAYSALQNADALFICTEWEEFKNPDFSYIKKHLKFPVIFDGRNILNTEACKKYGLMHVSIGSPLLSPSPLYS